VADPAITEQADSLGEQPAELRDPLRLAVVPREVDVDELAQPRRLDVTQQQTPIVAVEGVAQSGVDADTRGAAGEDERLDAVLALDRG
jgi:hypothetical protein